MTSLKQFIDICGTKIFASCFMQVQTICAHLKCKYDVNKYIYIIVDTSIKKISFQKSNI